MENGKVVCITGHRPNKLGGYGIDVHWKLVGMYTEVFGRIQPARVISGMALGADQAAAEAAIGLKIPVTAAIPFEGQESKWPTGSQVKYRELLAKCDTIVTVSPGGYSVDKMQIRNRWMVDNSEAVIALWNGSSGGTANCVEYARSRGKEILQLWRHWLTL